MAVACTCWSYRRVAGTGAITIASTGSRRRLHWGSIPTFRSTRRGHVTVRRDACLPLALIRRCIGWNCGGARSVDRRAILTTSGQCWTLVGRREAFRRQDAFAELNGINGVTKYTLPHSLARITPITPSGAPFALPNARIPDTSSVRRQPGGDTARHWRIPRQARAFLPPSPRGAERAARNRGHRIE